MRYVCPECGDGGEAAGACPADGADRAPVGADPLLGTTIGSWRVARMLGAGGMGRVYVAVQPQIGARVAIKVLKRESAADPDVVERFFNEARAVNMIKHEAIVNVIDLGRLPDGAPYIVMEYLDGASLGAIVRRDKKLALGTLARIAGEVLAALEAAHAKAIIHRDLKPDNVFISPSGRVTVLDFGVAKLAAGTEGFGSTQTGSLLGTPAYMSPEQARSQPLDVRSDLYAVGVILYEAATGKLPFVAQNLFDLLQMHVAQPPRPPRELSPEIPNAFEAVILRALAKDPADRFASAKAMREALAAAAPGLPQLALSSAVMAPESPGREKKSDPFAETAASDSIATDKTQASTPPAAKPSRVPEPPTPEPPLRQPVQLTRGMLLVLLGTAALLGLGGAALMMYLGNRDKPAATTRVAQVHDAATLVDAGEVTSVAVVTVDGDAERDAGVPAEQPSRSDGRVARTAVVDATAARSETFDAPARIAPADADVARSDIADAKSSPPDAGASVPRPKETVEQTLERLLKRAEILTIAKPTAVDPMAEYRRAVALVMPLGGKTTRMTSMRIHHANANGIIDMSTGGSLEMFFGSPGLAKAGEACYFLFIYEDGVAKLARAEQTGTDDCSNGVAPPGCSLPEIVQRALAKGMAIGKGGIHFNRFRRGWQVSTDDWSEQIDDDCE